MTETYRTDLQKYRNTFMDVCTAGPRKTQDTSRGEIKRFKRLCALYKVLTLFDLVGLHTYKKKDRIITQEKAGCEQD